MCSFKRLAFCCCFLIHFATAEIRTEAKCLPEDDSCEFYLSISSHWTMMHVISFGMMSPVVIDDNGTYFARSKSCDKLIRLTEEEISKVLIGDGTQKPVLVFNEQLPGPPIVVYEGQKVIVKVKNAMSGYVTTVHWHGQTMEGTPYMDGVAGITQYPIAPRQTFTYRFNATRVGTHWYHTHLGSERSMGAHGPLIVLPRPEKEPKEEDIEKDDFIMVVSDLMHEDTESIYLRMSHDNLIYAYGYENGTCYAMTKGVDGLEVGITPFISATVNGKGRYYPDLRGRPENPNIPLETFTVQKDLSARVRFRMISSSMTFSFKVSIDHHDLNVIATDGDDIDTVTVQYLIISPGERYDFWIAPTDPAQAGSYWIRLTTLEYSQLGEFKPAGHTAAILRYEGTVEKDHGKLRDPDTVAPSCTKRNMCKVLNCPFKDYPESFNYKCISLASLRAKNKRPILTAENEEDFMEIFLNFHFSGVNSLQMFKPNINGKVFLPSEKPLLLQTTDGPTNTVPCNETLCREEVCYCTHQINLPVNKVVQLVIFTAMPELSRFVTGTHHPVHLHGHHMEVIKVAYPSYEEGTRLFKATNTDIKCTINELCNEATWSNSSWRNGNVPDIIEDGAPRKDTIQVPGGGYVVVRFRSDNPGYWLMHCHMEIHNVLGMALVFKEGELEEMPNFRNTLHGLNKTNETNPDRVHLSESVLPQDSPNSQHLLKDTVIADAATDLNQLKEKSCKEELTDILVTIAIFALSSFVLFLILLRLVFLSITACRQDEYSSGLRGSGSHKIAAFEKMPLLT